jgi:hypothetical protein
MTPATWEGAFFEILQTGDIAELVGFGPPEPEDYGSLYDAKRSFLRLRCVDEDEWEYFTSRNARPLTLEACAFYEELLDAERRCDEAMLP